jgi:hypothetical protein
MKYLIMFLLSLGLLAALTIYAGTANAQSSGPTSMYFGGSGGLTRGPSTVMGNPCTWSISKSGCNQAPQQAQPQRIKQPRR